jgi:sulfur-carrier protein
MGAEAGNPVHRVFIPPPHRDLTGGMAVVEVAGATVSQVIDALDARFLGFKARLVVDEQLRPGISVAIDGTISPRGLRQRLARASEIHFVRAISGGGSQTIEHPQITQIFTD